MKRLTFFIIPALSIFPICFAQEKQQVTGDFSDFGIINRDTVLAMDCSEWAIDRHNPLFFADYRDELAISFDVVFHTFNTEQAVLCRESRPGNMTGDLTIGYDPGCNRIFAEVITDGSIPYRFWAGPATAVTCLTARRVATAAVTCAPSICILTPTALFNQ